jgi:mono/diheme cytochrome c family protein
MSKFVATSKKILKWSLISAAVLGGALTATVAVLERRTYDPGYPAIHASADPAVVARGRYLVHGPAHCTGCHGDPRHKADFLAGRDGPLTGGVEFHLPIGTVRSANITGDRETGIGGMRDEEIARSLRFGVRRDGRALAPFMPFANLSDEDLTAIVSYLRTQAPVRNQVQTRSMNPLGHGVLAFVLTPQGPTGPVPARVPPGPTVEYGKYLVHSVANCTGCHTQRDMRTGAFTGPTLAGGLAMTSHDQPGRKFVTPNLTPDAGTGRITNWNEEIFVARVRTGKGAEGSPMPWANFARMSEDDLKAIYRYLRTLPPVQNHTGDSVRPVEVAAR